MKSLIIAFSLFMAGSVFSQSIANTLGTSGLFTIGDQYNNYMTVSNPTGQVFILKTLRLENTTTTGLGIIFKGADRFIHNFSVPGTNASNTFLGIKALPPTTAEEKEPTPAMLSARKQRWLQRFQQEIFMPLINHKA